MKQTYISIKIVYHIETDSGNPILPTVVTNMYQSMAKLFLRCVYME